jgi:hypothetical protein
MAKTKISEYSATAANNTDVESVNIAEGCAPSGINNAIREVMSHLKDFQVGSAGDDLTVGGNFSVTGTVTIPDNAISGDKVEGGTINAITINTLSANPTLSAGTANGVTYLNGSKVLTSGSALTTNGSSLGVGSSDFGGAGSINVSVGVAGTTTGGLQLWSTTTGQHYVQFGDGTAGAATYAGAIGYSHATDQMFFYANGSEQMRLTSTGMGIGTSSPSSYASTTLEISGSSTSSDLKMTNTTTGTGDAAGFDLELNGSDISYVNRTASGNQKFWTNSTERMRIDASGNVGIGTSSPTTKLTISGTSAIITTDGTTSTGARGLDFVHSGQSYGSLLNYAQTGETALTAGYTGSSGYFLTFKTENTERMRITNAGNVGIGTSSPTQKLHISNNGNAYQLIDSSGIANGYNAATLYKNSERQYRVGTLGTVGGFAGGALVVYDETAAAWRMVINSAGNVGIGTTSPNYPLNVQGTGDTFVGITGGDSDQATLLFGKASNKSLGRVAYINSDNSLRLWTNGSERMSIDSSGNVIVLGAGSGSLGKLTTRSDGGTPLAVSNESVSGTLVALMGNGSGNLGSITHNGSGVAYNTTSDYRLKEDWVAVSNASTRVNALKPVNFAWIASGERVDGFLAHELAEVVPEAVTGEKDATEMVDIKDEEGNVTGQEERPVYQGIDQSKLVPLLTAALQEALAKIESLTARVSALEGN